VKGQIEVPNPTKYLRGYSFSGYQATNPKQPLPGPRVDDELSRVEQSTGSLVDAMEDIRRADGKLQNGIVTQDSFAPGLLAEIKGTVLTLYEQASALLVTGAEYLSDITAAMTATLTARDVALQAATNAAASATLLNAYLYDFNLGGEVADADWNQ
jgi:hypothetical protein